MSEYEGVLYAAPPPDGHIPNFNNPTNSGPLVIAICVLLPLTVVLTVCRVWTRLWMTRLHGLDDWLMETALVLNVVMCSVIFDMLDRGMGSHIYDVPLLVLWPGFMLRNVIIASIFTLASAIAKLSILAMYLRIFTAGNVFRTAIYVVAAFIASYGLATTLVNLFSCNPIAGSWDASLAPTATCIDRPAFYLAQACLGIVADIATVLVPIPAISQLKMDTRKKISVVLLLSMGSFVCIVSMIRLKSLLNMMNTTDLTRVTPDALMWCSIELQISIIGGSIPALKPLFKRYIPFLVSQSARSRTHGSAYPPQSFGGTQKSNKLSAISKTITVSVTRNERHVEDNDSVEELVNMRGRPQIVHDKNWSHAQ